MRTTPNGTSWMATPWVGAVCLALIALTTSATANDAAPKRKAKVGEGAVNAPASASPRAGVLPLPSAPREKAKSQSGNIENRQRVLVLDVKNSGVDANAVKTLANMLVLELSRIEGIDVLSGEDVRRMVELEVGRAQAGCTDESCVAEIADAMGATVVVFGNAGRIGRTSVFNLSLFDTSAGRSLSRTSIRTTNLEEIPDRLTLVMEEFVMPLIPAHRKAKVRAGLVQRSQQATERLAGPKKPKAVGFGMLVVRTDPPGAMVSVDGREIGPSPVTVEKLSEGLHFLEATAGPMLASTKVQVPPGGIERIELKLQKEPVRVVIVTDPPDATVFIDGERNGVAPLVLPSLSSGKHTFRAILKGHAAATKTLTLASEQEEHRVELKLTANADQTKSCVAGAVATNCGTLASQAWEVDDKESANAIWEFMCQRGNGNVCAFLAVDKIEKRPDQARELAKRGCKAQYGPACDLLAALVDGSRDKQTLAAEAVTKASAGFIGFKIADYSYAPSKTLCRDLATCHTFCTAGFAKSCRREAEFIRTTLDPNATKEEQEPILLEELRALKAACALDDTQSCEAIATREVEEQDTTTGTSTAALVFSPLLGVPTFGFLFLSGYAGVAGGVLGALLVLGATIGVDGEEEGLMTTFGIAAMLAGVTSAVLIGGTFAFLLNTLAMSGGKALTLTAIGLGASVATAVAAGAVSLVMATSTSEAGWLVLGILAPGAGAIVGGVATAIAAPFVIYESGEAE